jgi:hypothetical protein
MAETRDRTISVGRHYTYYPRRNQPGHTVLIVAVTPHPLHGAIVRFRYESYPDGRDREVTIGRFHTTPD